MLRSGFDAHILKAFWTNPTSYRPSYIRSGPGPSNISTSDPLSSIRARMSVVQIRTGCKHLVHPDYDGMISSLRPFADKVPTPATSRVVQHKLDLSGRTSSSLIFDHHGYIIGMNFAGDLPGGLRSADSQAHEYRVGDPGAGPPRRRSVTPLRTGQRSGKGRDRRLVGNGVADGSMSGADVPFILVSERGYSYDVYMAFADGWDGEAILLKGVAGRRVRTYGIFNLNTKKPRLIQRGFLLKTALPFRWPKLLLGTSGKA